MKNSQPSPPFWNKAQSWSTLLDLAEGLQVLSEEVLTVDETTDPSMLTQLDKTPYKLLIATDSFAMRGIDYRSKSKIMFLVVAKRFPCTREAL